jgi:phosphodiesterase/alkaline phosphatase D-like protein
VIYKNDRSATIQWHTDEDAKGVVEFGPTEELGFIRELPGTGKQHQLALTNLKPATQYFVKTFSTDLSNNGPTESEVLRFFTDAQADLAPPVLSGVQATPSDSTAIIAWTTDELADSFVEFSTDSLLLEFKVGDAKDVLQHEMVLTNLQPATQYFYVVGSVDRANNPPAESNTLRFTTLAGADRTPPAAPAGLSLTPGSGQVILSWAANAEPDLGGYNVYRKEGDGPFALMVSRLFDTRYADLGLGNGTTYQYQLTALDRTNPPNESAPSPTLSVTPVASAAPSAPTGLRRTGENFLRPTLVFANATPVKAGAALTYTLQVSTQPDFSNVTASVSGLSQGSGQAGTGQTAWTTDRDLALGQTYYWRVRAVEGELIGPFSQAQSFTAAETGVLPGDFNGDQAVNFDDFFLFVDAFGKPVTGSTRAFDLSGDGQIGFDDFFVFVDNFGKTAAGKRWARAQGVDQKAVLWAEALGGTRPQSERVVVRLWAEEVERLKAFGLVLEYDPQVLRLEQASPGPGGLLESRGGRAPLFAALADRPGQLILGNGLTQGEPVWGSGLLAELSFALLGQANDAYFDLREAYVVRPGAEVFSIVQLRSAVLRPRQYALHANYPNPFNPSTTIEYALPEAAPVEVAVYDVLGQKVRVLAREKAQPAGFYRLAWDGRDAAGQSLGSGVYLYRLVTPAFAQTRKMTLIK